MRGSIPARIGTSPGRGRLGPLRLGIDGSGREVVGHFGCVFFVCAKSVADSKMVRSDDAGLKEGRLPSG